jgi:hypothetical protein
MTARLSPLAALSFAAIVSLAVVAEAAPRPGTRISVTACPYAGTTASCLMMKGGDGTVYNITRIAPRPTGGRMIRLRGTVSDKVSICNEGVVLDHIRWTRTRQKCPK